MDKMLEVHDREHAYWIDVPSALPRESKTICSKCRTEKRFRYRENYCSQCGSLMVGLRTTKPAYRDIYLWK